MPIKFVPHRFKSAAEYYVRGRLSYPPALISRVASLTGLTAQDRVLDLGCGPGFLAVAFASHAREVIGIDPEPAMLREAEHYARHANATANVSFRQGSSYDLAPELGQFRLVTMGRSFHWMDRTATLEKLLDLTPADGVVALFDDSRCKVPANDWQTRIQAVLEPYTNRDEDYTVRRGKDWKPHLSYLLESQFNRVEQISVIQKIGTPVERHIDRVLSKSSTSLERLGADLEPVLEKLRAILNEEAVNGVVTEVVEFRALLGFRTS
ncbi:class I SAM-dependent methyltransferase [Opitutaceae bacterium TAV4]|nr:class I SAM-dependent methyltransferase [Opitutaceae bacterium TAV4]RRJ98539.1 class I SAM-dependent methyltransferase [Opitutaceae bacterium TAV3]